MCIASTNKVEVAVLLKEFSYKDIAFLLENSKLWAHSDI